MTVTVRPGFPTPARLATPNDLMAEQARMVVAVINPLVADAFALYLKAKNDPWHLSGPHFRDDQLLGEQADPLLAMTDPLAERGRKLGGTTLRSVGPIRLLQRVEDEDFITPLEMLNRLAYDNGQFAARNVTRTRSATRTATTPPRACWRSLSTRPNSAPGSSSRPCRALSARCSGKELPMTVRLNRGHFHFYPSRQLVGVIDGSPALDGLLADAAALGVPEDDLTVLYGEAGERWLDVDGTWHGPLGRLVRWTQFLTVEGEDVGTYEDALAAGRYVVAVTVARGSAAYPEMLAAFRRANGHDVRYFGPLVVEDEA